ncbi:MAG: phage holin family protein [Peptococcaceae bacterium]|nr:phage holin family protein [Peptococcaceae bacterium]
MDKVKYVINGVAGLAGIIASKWLGGTDKILFALLCVMAVDYITGLIVAGFFKCSPKTEGGGLESRAGFQGLIRKVGMLALIVIAVQLDIMAGTNIARDFTIMFFFANESLSILENLALMNVPMPPFLKKALEVMRNKAGEGTNEGTSNEQ